MGFKGLWSLISLSPRGPRQLGEPSISLTAGVEGASMELTSQLVDLDVADQGTFAVRDELHFVGRRASATSFPLLLRQFVARDCRG